MHYNPAEAILLDIIRTDVGGAALEALLVNSDKIHKLLVALQRELDVALTVDEIQSVKSLRHLALLVLSRMPKSRSQKNLVDVYADLHRLAKEELDSRIDFHWYARWEDYFRQGLLDSLGDVEFVMRLEEEFALGIPDEDAQTLLSGTVAETVHHLHRRIELSYFSLREYPPHVCKSAFVFNELRRLLISRAGISRNSIRLEARLGDLMPYWYAEFWKQVRDIFQANLPKGCPLAFGRRFEKRTTIKELVQLIVSAQKSI